MELHLFQITDASQGNKMEASKSQGRENTLLNMPPGENFWLFLGINSNNAKIYKLLLLCLCGV